YPESGRLVTLYHSYPGANIPRDMASLTTYYERRGNLPALASLSAISQSSSVIGETGATTLENVGRVTPEFFATLGIELFLGRAFTDAEMTYQTDHVAIISHEFWRNHFNSDPEILHRSVRLAGIPRRIVGVLPPGFRFLSFTAPIYSPLSSENSERNLTARHNNTVMQVARLAPGATLADAQAQVDAYDAANASAYPEASMVADAGFRTHVVALHADHVASARPLLLLLQGAALCLLLIGGVNLANLLLIRASGRARDLAIRQALGAGARHIVREVMAETILLTAAGALLGLLVGAFGLQLFVALGANRLPLGTQIVLDGRLAAITLLGGVITGCLLAVPLIWFNLRGRLAVTLQGESRGSTSNRKTQRLRQVFVVAQIALAFVLLTGAGLLGLSLRRVMAVSPGFRTEQVLTGRFTLPWSGYNNLKSFHLFFDRLEEQARALPGVVATGAVSNLPLNGVGNGSVMTIPGHAPRPGESAVAHDQLGVAGDYFVAMGIPLLSGRYLKASDVSFDTRSCVVDAAFAQRYWPAGGAVGQPIFRDATVGPEDKPYTIVGVVGTVKQQGLTERSPVGTVYFPYSHIQLRDYYLVARTSLPPEVLAPTFVRLLRAIDPELPLTDVRSMAGRIDHSLAATRTPALLAALFAATALLLSVIGLYGVMSYSVAQRTGEFGIRMALGAQRADVLGLVLGQGLRLVVLGLAVGLTAALLLTDAMSSLLFDVRANDPLALGGIAALLAIVAAFACWLPARRATKVDPMVALRAE
ncbi:MAG TPA: ADOP family duplicated permease, partial [Lacunisphaera sp.]|nr:ADOP family duplicated permease [Lacunisphaera sp.]